MPFKKALITNMSDEGTYDTNIASEVGLTSLKAMLSDHGCTKIFVKELAPNDNSKNQIYLGGSFDSLIQIPIGEWTRVQPRSRKNSIKNSSVLLQNHIPFSWVLPDGEVRSAPRAKLIYYPQYPEVRFSGFLLGSGINASQWMAPERAGRSEGRFLVWGIRPGKKSFGYLAVPGSRLQRELSCTLVNPSTEKCGVLTSLVKSTSQADKALLLENIRSVIASNPHFGQQLDALTGVAFPYSAPNAGGMTLEALFCVPPNGDAKPDFRGWELKGHSRSVITLLTPEPDNGFYVEQGVEKFVRRFGYPDKKGRPNRLNFGGIHKSGVVHPTTGLTLALEGAALGGANTKFNADGYLGLVDSKGVVAASWSFEKLLNHWTKKHTKTAFIRFEKLKNVEPNCFAYLSPVHLGEGTSFTRFLNSVASGEIYYDPGIKLYTDKATNRSKRRSQFRVAEKNLPSLYDKYSTIKIDGY